MISASRIVMPIVCAPLDFALLFSLLTLIIILWLQLSLFVNHVFCLQNLAAQKTYNNLSMSMKEALRRRRCFVEGVIKCYPDETLETAVDRIADAEVVIRFKLIKWKPCPLAPVLP